MLRPVVQFIASFHIVVQDPKSKVTLKFIEVFRGYRILKEKEYINKKKIAVKNWE